MDGFVYLGGMVMEDGHSEVEVRRRIQAGASVWRKEEGVNLDRNKSPESVCYTDMPVRYGDSAVDRTTTEAASL